MYALKRLPFALILLVLSFLSREIFLAGAFPFFTGQDEARHYNTVQWISQNQKLCLKNSELNNAQDKENLATYRFSEEIRETSNAASSNIWREENYRKLDYTAGNMGTNEGTIQESRWGKSTLSCPPDIVSTAVSFSLFHEILGTGEKVMASADIMTRFYLGRLLSVFFGTLTIILAYFVAREARFSRRAGLLIALILSLHPRLSIYTTNINYDTLLIPCFALFLWGGLRCLRQGITFTNVLILTIAFGGAFSTKGIGLTLIGGFIFLGTWLIVGNQNYLGKLSLFQWLRGVIILGTLIFIINHLYSITGLFPHFSFSSLFEYLSKSIPRIPSSSENFWGIISWNASTLGAWFVSIIWVIEGIALYGLFRFLSTKKLPSFLPSKVATLFCLILLLSLQLGVRVYDWHVFQNTGSLDLGTPGRYFLPTLLPQLILIAVGLGALLKKQLYLERALVGLALLMLAFNLYTVWLIIIPRFYL